MTVNSLKTAFAALAVAGCGAVAGASAAQPVSLAGDAATETAATDSVTDAAATFIVSNMRQGIDMVLRNIADMGLEVDSAQVVALVKARLSDPYDAVAHRNAARRLSAAAEKLSASREREFMEAARARSGAETTGSGLVIETLRPGSGPTVASADTVVFHYRGVLPGGNVFDNTAGGEPLRSVASNLVPGMTEGLSHMSRGGQYRLTIPSALAYGNRGAGDVIPPNTPLEFTIEIVEIVNSGNTIN